MFYDDEDLNGNDSGTEESSENDSGTEESSGNGGGTSEDNVGSDNEQSGGETQNPTWSWDNNARKVVYGKTDGDSICEISGFGDGETVSNFSGLTVDQTAKTITVTGDFLSRLTKDATLSASGGYSFANLTKKTATLDNTSASAAGSVDENGELKINGTISESYELLQGKINFKAAQTKLIATVKGLSANASSGFSVNGSNIVLETAALGNSVVTITPTAANNGTDKINLTFKLKSGDNDTLDKLGFSDDGNTWTVNGTSATYQQKRSDGWKLESNTVKYYAADDNTVDLATITGLKSGLQSGDTIEGITVTSTPEGDDSPTTTTFKLADSVLGTDEVSVAGASNSTVTYLLGLTGDDGEDHDATASDKRLGFKDGNKTWTFNNGTATYGYSTAEGWTLSGDSTKITHTEAVPHTLLTLTGLSSGFSASLAITEPVDNGEPARGTVTLVAEAFDTAAENPTISISGESDSTKYELSVDTLTSALTLDDDPQIKVNTTDGVKLIGKTHAYYTLGSNNASATYHAANENYTLATIEGAASTVNADAFSITSGSKVVTVKKAALDGSAITITNTDNKPINYTDYTLALDTSENNDILTAPNHVDTTADITYADGKITGKTLGYYTSPAAGDDAKTITYTAGEENATLATITGLKENATSDDVTVSVLGDTMTVTVGKNALSSTSTAQFSENSTSYTYDTTAISKWNFAFKTNESNDDNSVGYETVNEWAVTDGTATYKTHRAEGWYISNSKIFHESATPPNTLITVTGLKDEVKAGTGDNAGKLGTETEGNFNAIDNIISINNGDNTVTIDTNYLKPGSDATVSATDYKFKLKGDNNTQVGMTPGEYYWTVKSDEAAEGKDQTYTVTYKRDSSDGWKLEGGTIKYVPVKTEEYFSISGLKLNDEKFGTLAAGETAKYSSLEGITAPAANAADADKYTFKLADSVLGNGEIKLTNGTDAGADTYKLAIEGSNTSDSGDITYGFGKDETKKYWALGTGENAGKVFYQYDTEQGWTLDKTDQKTITYTDVQHNVVATIEGLKADLTADQLNGKGADVEEGITVSAEGVITLKKSVLDETANKTVTLTPKEGSTYTLALDTTNEDNKKVSNITNTSEQIGLHLVTPDADATSQSVKIKTTRDAGWIIASESLSMTYHDAVDTTLATVSGLNKSIEAYKDTSDSSQKFGIKGGTEEAPTYTEVLSLNGNDVKLKAGALVSGIDVTINKESGGENYALKLVNAEGTEVTKFGIENGTDKYWTVKDGTASYKYDIPDGWELKSEGEDSGKVKYSPVTPVTLVTINGLAVPDTTDNVPTKNFANNIVVSGSGTVEDPYKFTVKTSAVSTDATTEANAVTLGGIAEADSGKYQLQLDNAIGQSDGSQTVGFDKSAAYWTVEQDGNDTYTATYQYDIAEGWTIKDGKITYTPAYNAAGELTSAESNGNAAESETPNTVIMTITGLKLNSTNLGKVATGLIEGAKTKYTSLTGVSLPAEGDAANLVNLNNSVLDTTNIVLTNGTKADGTTATYKLGFAGETNANGTVGFKRQDNFWTVSDGSATYAYNTTEGWKLNDNGTTIEHTPAVKNTPLATLEGFKPTIKNVTDLQNAITTTPDASDKKRGTITLKADALPTNLKDSETTITLTNEEGAQYTLALDNGISNITDKSTTTALDFSNSEQGRVKLKETRAAGWVKSKSSAASEGQDDAAEGETTPAVNKVETFTYKAAVDITHIELSGLKPAKENTAKANITFAENTVYLDKGALTNQDVNLKVNDNDNDTEPTTYTVKLKGDAEKFGFEADGYGWELYTKDGTEGGTEESDTQTAGKTYQYYPKQKEGWTTYVGEDSEGDDNVKLVVEYSAAGINHDNPIAKISGLADNLVTGGTIADSLVSVTNGTNEHIFTISADAIEKVAGNVVKVNAATETSDDSETSGGTTSTPTYTLKLKDANADGEVGFAKGTPYLVAALADDDSEADVLADDDESDEADSYTATYQRDIGEGWRLVEDHEDHEDHIVYIGASNERPKDTDESDEGGEYIDTADYYSSPEELIRITGLNKNVCDSKDNVTGISTSDGKTFTISPNIVNKNVGVVTLEVDEENKTGYKLALEGANTEGKVGFKERAPHYLVTKDDSEDNEGSELYTVTYEFDVEEGWTLESDGKITYTPATDAVNEDDDNEGEDEESKNKATVLVTISGLKAPKGTKLDTDKSDDSEDIDGKKFSALEGISYDDTTKTFTIDESLLGASDITLEKGADTYKLAIKDATDGKFGFEDSVNYWVINDNGTATFQHDVTEGWTLNKDAKTIEYSPARKQPNEGEDEYTAETDETAPIVIATLEGINGNLKSKPLPTEGNDDENSDASENEGDDTDKYIDDCISYDADTSTFTVTDMELFNPADDGKLELVPYNNNAVKLALGDDIATAASVYYNAEETEDEGEDTKPKNPTLEVGSGDATITGTLNPYVKLASNAKSIDYTAQKNDITLATVSGLGYGATDGKEGNITLNGNIITLKDGSLDKNKNVKAQITVNDSALKAAGVPEADLPAYTFALDSEVSQTPKVFNPDTESFTVSKVDKGTATIQGDTLPYYSLSDDGKFVSYNESTKLTVAEVTGLKSAATTANVKITGDKTNGYTVSISKDALDKSDIAFVSKKALAPLLSNSDSDSENKFKFSLAIDGVTPNDEDGTATYSLASTPVGWTVSNGVATYKETAGESWTFSSDASVITYTAPVTNEVVTIKGLDSKLKTMPDGITVDTSKGTITIAPAALETLGKNELTFVTDDYDLQFTDGEETSGFGKGDNTWVVSNGTATYQQAIGEGYTISGNKLTYSPATAETLFKISGLSGIANGTYKSIDGVEFDGETITLSEKVLGNSSVTLTRSENDYKLEIDGADNGKLGGEEAEEASWVIYKDGTAKYQKVTSATYQVNKEGDTISYTPAKEYDTATVYATLKGLDSSITVAQLENSNLIEKTVDYTIESDKVKTKGTMTIHAGALGTGTVTLESDYYNLALGTDVAKETDYVTKQWTSNKKGTATYTQNTAAHYEQDGNSVKYVKASSTTLATVSGLKTGLEAESNDDRPASIEGIFVSGNKILVSDAALGTTTAKLTLPKNAENMTLAYIGSATEEAATAATGANWLVSGGTATLKELKPAYYKANEAGTQITYTGAAAVKENKKEVVYAVIKGVSKTADKNDFVVTKKYQADTDGKVTEKGVITLTADALNKADITLNKDYRKYYTLALANGNLTDADNTGVEAEAIAAPQVDNATWSLSKTTATYKGNISEGYTASSDGNTITYTKAQNSATLLTISGIPSGVSVKNDGLYVTDSNGHPVEAVTITDDRKVIMSEAALALTPTKLTLKGTGYEFAFPPTSSTASSAAAETDSDDTIDSYTNILTSDRDVVKDGIDVWRVSGTTATYKKVIPAHYEIDSKGALVYKKEQDHTFKDGKTTKKTVYATITGLAKGLHVDDKGKVVNSDDEEVVSLNGTNVEVKASALGNKTVKLTPGATGNYKLTTSATTPQPSDAYWLYGGSTATLKEGSTAGYEEGTDKSGNPTITYKKASGSTLATVTGLKKGLKLEADNFRVEGIELNGTTITLEKVALGTSNIKLNNAKGQSFKLDAEGATDGKIASKDDQIAYSYSGSTFKVNEGKSAAWTLKGNNLNISTKAKMKTIVTVTGLKKGLTQKADGTIDGITVNGETITLSKDVLGTGTVKVTGGTLDLAEDVPVKGNKPDNTYTWAVSGNKITLKETEAGYYTQSSNNTLKYTKPKTTNVATVTGVKKGLKVNSDGTIDGIEVSGKTITLDNRVLDYKDVSVSGTGGYTPDLGTGVNISEGSGSVWSVSGTTATLKQANAEGYTFENGEKKIKYYTGTKGTTVLTTVSGLKKGLKVNANGAIDGIKVEDKTITLSKDVLGTTNVTSSKYKLEMDKSVTESKKDCYKLEVDKNGDIKVYSDYTTAGFIKDNDKKLTYTKSSGGKDLVATISGLKSGLKATDGQIDGIEVNGDEENTITLGKDVLDGKDVSIKNEEGSEFALGLAENVSRATTKDPVWSAPDATTAVYSADSTGGYSIAEESNSITYTDNGGTKVVISGLSGVTADKAKNDIQVSGNTFTVPVSLIGNTTVSISGDNKLAVSGTPTPAWQVSGTTATLVQTASKDQYLCDGATITKVTADGGASKVLATITGLPENFNAGVLDEATEDGVITLPEVAFTDNTSDIKLTGTGYTLSTTNAVTPTAENSAVWSVVNIAADAKKKTPASTTATLATGKTAGYTLSDDGKTLTYSDFVPADKATLATITGLKEGLTLSDVSEWNTNSKEITLSKDMLGSTNVEVSKGYTLALDKDVPQVADAVESTETYSGSGSNITINTTAGIYYKPNTNKTKIEVQGGATTVLGKLSGLPKDTTLNGAGTVTGVSLDKINKTINLTVDMLGTGTIALTSTEYTLTLPNGAEEPNHDDYAWTISKGKATLKETLTTGYTLEDKGKSIKYNKEATVDVATLEGLKTSLKAEDGEIEGVDIDENNGVIIVSEEALSNGNVTLKMGKGVEAGTYTLALDSDVPTADSEDVQTGEDVWSTSGTTATLKHVTPAYYTLDGNTIKYTAAKEDATLATVSNVVKFDAEDMFDAETKTITLSEDNLDGKTVTVKGTGYKLALDSVSEPEFDSADWSKSGTTATLNGTRTAGYTLSSDEQTVTYSASKSDKLAVISGTTDDFDGDVDTYSEKVTLSGLSNKVTVSGSFELDFDSNFKGSITGSANAEKIAVGGTEVTVSAGAGNDYIDLGTKGGNTVVYSGGNDSIANFTATGTNKDTLQLSGSVSVSSAAYDDGDVILTLSNKNTITLENFGEDSINYLDSKGASKSINVASADLMTSDNFIGADSDLGAITDSGAYKLGDFNATALANDYTELTKQSSPLTFGNKK